MKFVVHFHSTEIDHYDFMLENNDILLTWRIDLHEFNRMLKGEPASTVKIHDHSRKYLDYQCPVSCGIGHVKLIDTGEYKLIDEKIFILNGRILSGTLTIEAGIDGNDKFLLIPSAAED